MPVFPFGDTQAIGAFLVRDGAVVPANDQNDPVGLFDPALADGNRELVIATEGLSLHRDFEKLDPVSDVLGYFLDDLRCFLPVLIEIPSRAADQDLDCSHLRLWHGTSPRSVEPQTPR